MEVYKRLKQGLHVNETESEEINSVLNYKNDTLFRSSEVKNVSEGNGAPDDIIGDTNNSFIQENLNDSDLVLLPSKIDFQNDSEITGETNFSEKNDETTIADELIQESQTSSLQVSEPTNWEMNEKIVLQRHNCNLELPIDDIHDTKLRILFEPLHSNMSGRCCIVLNGKENSKLAIFIQDIHILSGIRGKEILKVVQTNFGIDFVLKRYDGSNINEPQSVLLTESNQAYIFLDYMAGGATLQDYSHFNLEVFIYEKKKNYVHHDDSYNSKPFDWLNAPLRSDNIYITTKQPIFHNQYYLKNNLW
ncbi:hypothetical protein RUM43_010894 [Polyplax serrata]|uniref:Uncharacterized protein n=1 Tax=Polyplax serrata TaxID=468196 RepID=A0AAN8PDX6_POLSC